MTGKLNFYIPRELLNYILSNRTVKKRNLWRYIYDNMVNRYSIFSVSDYYQIVKYVLREFEDNEILESYPEEYYDKLEDKWLHVIENSFNKFLVDEDGYSKIALILTIIEYIQSKYVIYNRFYLLISEGYNAIWRKNKPKSIKSVPNFYKVIITLNECSFYKIKLVEGATLNVPQKRRVWDKETALNYIDYGYLDDELFDLIYRDSFRMKLLQMIKIYTRAFDK